MRARVGKDLSMWEKEKIKYLKERGVNGGEV